MGLLDSVLGAVGGDQAAGGGLAEIAGKLLAEQGGLGGLIEKFQSNGLGDVVQSWVGTGSNLPISAEQIQSVLGNEQLAGLASQFGLDPQQLASQISGQLPGLVDQLTPDGAVPEGGAADLLGSLGKLMGR